VESLVQTIAGNILVAVAIAALACASRRLRRPALTHAIFLLALVKLVTPPIWRAPVLPAFAPDPRATSVAVTEPATVEEPATSHWEMSPDAAAPANMEAQEGARSVRVAPPTGGPAAHSAADSEPFVRAAAGSRWPAIGGAIWAVGATCVLALGVRRACAFGRLLRAGSPAPEGVLVATRMLAEHIGLRRTPAVILVPATIPPLVWSGIGRPRIVLPATLVSRLAPQALHTLLAHELAHVARRDHIVRYFEMAVGALYWWLPLVPIVRRELRRAEEECCDAWVVGVLARDAKTYAHALLETVDFVSKAPGSVPAVASGIGAFETLKRRLTMILEESLHHRLRGPARLLLIVLAALALPLVPTWAQDDERFPETKRFIEELEGKLDAARDAGRERAVASLEREIQALKDLVSGQQGAGSYRPARRRVEAAEAEIIERRAQRAHEMIERTHADEARARDEAAVLRNFAAAQAEAAKADAAAADEHKRVIERKMLAEHAQSADARALLERATAVYQERAATAAARADAVQAKTEAERAAAIERLAEAERSRAGVEEKTQGVRSLMDKMREAMSELDHTSQTERGDDWNRRRDELADKLRQVEEDLQQLQSLAHELDARSEAMRRDLDAQKRQGQAALERAERNHRRAVDQRTRELERSRREMERREAQRRNSESRETDAAPAGRQRAPRIVEGGGGRRLNADDCTDPFTSAAASGAPGTLSVTAAAPAQVGTESSAGNAFADTNGGAVTVSGSMSFEALNAAKNPRAGVPVLSDIPGLGDLFKSTSVAAATAPDTLDTLRSQRAELTRRIEELERRVAEMGLQAK
jgi:bla regulator protein blaR1